MKTAVLLDDTNISELNYSVITEINGVLPTTNDDIFLLVNNVSAKVIKPECAVINSSKLANVYDGLVIATNIGTAKSVIKAAINSVKLFYIFDLEWLYSSFPFDEYYDIINNEKLLLVCRSELHADIIANAFDRRPTVLPFSLGDIWNSLDSIKNVS